MPDHAVTRISKNETQRIEKGPITDLQRPSGTTIVALWVLDSVVGLPFGWIVPRNVVAVEQVLHQVFELHQLDVKEQSLGQA